MSLSDHIKDIVKFQDERNWKQFHDQKNLALSLILECSEVLELFQWSKKDNLSKSKQEELAEELADVYYYVLLLAHESNINIEEAFKKKMKKNRAKYPVEKAKGKSTKYNKL